MIKNIIFDFGDIFVNLDKQVIFREIEKFGGQTDLGYDLNKLNNIYEVGAISSEEFIAGIGKMYPKANNHQIIQIWNSMILDLPDYRLEFIEQLASERQYRLFLLSNTNDLHIPYFEEKIGSNKFQRFKNSFEKFYLSHEIQLRKPNLEIFQFVLGQNGLRANETFFIDDTKENTEAAESLGIRSWNLLVGKEDIINLKTKLPNG